MAYTATSKQELISKLKKQISIKDSTAIHTLLFIYNRQIDDEQQQETVKYRNGIGFKPQDVKLGSSFAKWYNDKGFLTAKQIVSVKKLVEKYAGQVIESKICSGEIVNPRKGLWIWK